ncbi:unnamed protein product [Phytophthora fragariaefolia]|uniref:Unnamed protein product n=1 Tax=Phytophthora fragariaefolia TaxID=1490495 RepID=A0A9W6XY67_9STRA|nr:unnamed protein product [Phytophthora fragariaefolia]
MAGFYRRFIPNFGSKAAPMTRLLRKDAVWRWAGPQQEAFEELQKALTGRPVLAYPDFSRPFKLVTDASQVRLRAALTQDQGKGEQPVAYASKVNSPTVAKYSITDLECAAVIWAVKLFRPYLYGRHFELGTDHAALKWLTTWKDLTGRLHRWALQLQEYNFTVVYRPGAGNVVADAMSRASVKAVVAGQSAREVPELYGGEGQITDAEIKSEQARDKTVKRLLEKGRYGASIIEESHGLVFIRNEHGGRRVVLPSTLWAKALREHHDSIFACHLRTQQTYARIAAVYWWPDMRAHVRCWVQACRDCGSRKSKAKEVVPPLRSQEVETLATGGC